MGTTAPRRLLGIVHYTTLPEQSASFPVGPLPKELSGEQLVFPQSRHSCLYLNHGKQNDGTFCVQCYKPGRFFYSLVQSRVPRRRSLVLLCKGSCLDLNIERCGMNIAISLPFDFYYTSFYLSRAYRPRHRQQRE